MSPRDVSIELKITHRCNLECFHCMNEDGPEAEGIVDVKIFNSRLEEWDSQKNASEFLIREVRMTGGEPLLQPEAVCEIARCCSRLGIKSGINTNGVFLEPEILRRLQESGLTVIKISLDCLSGPNRIAPEALPLLEAKMFRGIEDAVRAGFRVILRLTLSRYSEERAPSYLRLARSWGVHKFQIKPLIRAGRAVVSGAFLDKERIEAVLRELEKAVGGEGPQVEVLCWPPDPSSPLKGKSCGSMNKIYIFPDLRVGLCNYLPGCRVFGDLAAEPFEALLRRRPNSVWTSPSGYRLLEGCPNSIYFGDGRIP